MALVNILNVNVLDNPSHFLNPFQFEITFECLQELQDDLEWKVVYVGDAENTSQDQTLEEVMVGPVAVGINRFVLQANAPNPLQIRNEDLIGVTVILITCSYYDHRFVQIGYYVNNEYAEPFDPENYPKPVEISKLFRHILAEQPRVTRYPIDWSGANLPLGSEVYDDPQNEQQQQPATDHNDVEIDMTQDMEEEDDDEDDDDDDEEGGNGNDEIDLEDEEDDEEGDGEEEDDDEEGDSPSDADLAVTDEMVCVNEDSNSIDIDRMLQK